MSGGHNDPVDMTLTSIRKLENLVERLPQGSARIREQMEMQVADARRRKKVAQDRKRSAAAEEDEARHRKKLAQDQEDEARHRKKVAQDQEDEETDKIKALKLKLANKE